VDRSLFQLVAEQASARPEAIALEDGEKRLAYAELIEAAERIASGLLTAGVDAEDVVGVDLCRSWRSVCAYLGTVRAGAGYMPLNPSHPPKRRQKLAELAGARAVIADDREGSLDINDLLATPAGTALPEPLGNERLACVLFTSGSTGTPKAVELTHSGLVNLLRGPSDLLPGPDDAILHKAVLDFDGSVLEIWSALLNGARLVLSPPGDPDPVTIGEVISSHGVTMAIFPPGLLGEMARFALPQLAGLRVLASGGDVLPPALAAELRAALPETRFVNLYGPTETTIFVCAHEINGEVGETIPIGLPVPGAELHVLDEQGEPVADGTSGELWIGGAGVARGYRNDPERTAERFRPNPFGGGRVYRSGDLVRRREDKELLFLGRVDDQVKLSGHRVEPGEIERALAARPEVREAAVAVREDVPGHKRVIGYAVPYVDGALDQARLQARLGTELPKFMVPAAIVPIDALPLTERGKVDRRALPAPPRQTERETLDPRLEPIAAAMAEVLRLESVGPREDFFALGGTSLLALRLTGLLRDRLATDLDIGDVFEGRTAAALAERIEQESGRPAGLPPLTRGESRPAAPLSSAQRRAWLFCRTHPESIAYQFAAIFRLEGDLDVAALRGALTELIRRHEILRTSFEERGGEPVQVIHPPFEAPLAEVDLRGEGPDAWARLSRAKAREQVGMAPAPLVRWTLARLGEDSWRLIQVEHHLVHDGWSFALLSGELGELYSARVEGRAPDLPEPAAQFQDYTRWEQRARASEAVGRQVEHWAAVLDPDPPLLQLPGGARPRPPRESFSGGLVRRRLPPALVTRMRALGRDSEATLFMVSVAAFLAQLQRYSGQGRQQIGTGIANRREPLAERLIGMTVNTVALRCDLGGDPTVRELLARVRAMAIESYANADAPFDAVVDAIGPPRDRGRSPLIQMLFSFHDAPRRPDGWSELEATIVEGIPNGTAKADLNVIGNVRGDSLSFSWEHSDLLDDAAADRLASHHQRLLEQFVESPDARLSELDLLTAEERTELERWSDGPSGYDREATLAGLIEAQAERDPAALAVLDGIERLSYGELLQRARAVAGALQQRGIGRGDRVGVLFERSAGAVVAFCGTILAGAAYVPLDPLHPPARIVQALADADARLCLVEGLPAFPLPLSAPALTLSQAENAGPAPSADIGADDLAYVTYTSGSTGEAKGVEVTHRNVVRLVDTPCFADLGPGRVMLHAASPAFDATTLELWGPLASGGTVACLRERPSPAAIAAAIERHRVDVLWLTAGLFHELVDRRPDCLAGIDHLLAGGAVLSPEHVRRALAALPSHGRLTNGYGPTETTTFATTHEMRPGETLDGPMPIGRPIQGTSCRVLDAAGREVPIGQVGELVVGGDGVARGYRGDPELTAARFRPDPRNPSGRLYLTGDLVRRRPDGALEFAGRADRQVKIRGHRVEPAEVENTLRTHPEVADAAVVPFERAPGDLALAAYVVAKGEGAVPEAGALRAHVTTRLPGAMVPSAWISLSELPLTANGKLDLEALPTPGAEHLARNGRGAEPANELERRVVVAFERVLEVGEVGVEDDFFALGGHSMLAVALFGRLERIAGRRLPLALLSEAPTPRALAAALAAPSNQGSWENLVALKPSGNRPPLFAVAAGDGNIVGFGPLARNMPEDQPFYALQPSGLDGRRPLDTGIEEMAERYLRAVRAVQPHGPYLLAGRCNGVTVAFEMAQRLRAAGEEVPLLVAIDSDPPAPKPAELVPGVPYDEFMESAAIRARLAGEQVPDPQEPGGGARLLAWLREPVAPGISRYVHEFWRSREDLRSGWPDPLGADAAAYSTFIWSHAYEELEPRLIVPAESWRCRTPDGRRWDWAQAAAWERSGYQPRDPISPTGWQEFRTHLLEPAAGCLNNYLLGALERPDLRAAFGDPQDAPALLEWAWEHGVDEGLSYRLLPPAPWPLSRRRRLELALQPARDLSPRLRFRASGRGRRLAEVGRRRLVDRVEWHLGRPLPGAVQRTIFRAVDAARKARGSYRADSWPGKVVLIVSDEFREKHTFLGWEVRAEGGVERHELAHGHVDMLREPGARDLASCLSARIEEGLAGNPPGSASPRARRRAR
jgi:amino acid adenylation domain-containing protein